MTPQEMLKQLRQVQKKHINEFTPTFGINVSQLAKDAADTIEGLLESSKKECACAHQSLLFKLAYQDSLVGCYNRNMLEKMSVYYDDVERTVVFVDIDNFKQYNTVHGHFGGDRKLKEIGDHLLRIFASVFRLGGDEFLIVTEQPSFEVDRLLYNMSDISYGIYVKKPKESLGEAMYKADIAMYEHKQSKQKTEGLK